VLATAAACSAGGSHRQAAETPSTSRQTVPEHIVDAPTTTTTPKHQTVVLAFAGDVHFEGVLRDKLATNPTGMFAPIAPLLSAADLAMVNLETAITQRGTPQPKEFTFRAPATAFTAVQSAGVDVVSMANNHGVDYGPVGLLDSLAAIQATKFPVVGIGADAAHAYAPYRKTIRGERISIIGATQVLDDALIPAWTATDTHAGLASAKVVPRLVAAVKAARQTSDTVVVFLHWGQEGNSCATATQQTLARQLVDAGADIIVGSHAHLVVSGGKLGNAFVDYGLGNFAFYSPPGPTAQSGVLYVYATGRHIDGYDWIPAQISAGIPHRLEGTAAAAAETQWNARRSCTGLTP
jgi:poly-gamma-glutamate capsule biosynthesis protein CapA/YwtB (metallophosphatase superfamily)